MGRVFVAALAALALMGVKAEKAQAQQIILAGTVSANCVVSALTSNGSATTLPIATAWTGTVGTLTVNCNYLNGFNVTATSSNSGFIVNNGDATNKVAYTMSLTGPGATPAAQLTVPTALAQLSPLAGPMNQGYPVIVSKPAFPTAKSGVFQDIVTLTLQTL